MLPVVNEVIVNKPGFRPVLVDFQNGKIRPGEDGNLKSAFYRSKEKETVVSVTGPKMVYTGVIDNENDLYNNFLVVHDKRHGKVRLIQVDCCTVSPLLDKKTNLLNTSTSKSETSAAELRKQFGSKKSKKHTEQQERLKMNIDTVKEQLEQTISEIKIDERDMNLTPDENNSIYRPKINRDASTREQVYNLDDIVPRSVLETLSSEADNIIETGNVEEYSLVPLAANGISRILTSSADSHKVAIFLYINYIIKFINVPIKQISKKFVICDKSAEVNQHIIDNYALTTGKKLSRPMYMKDKALCFVLVLVAIASDYEVDVEAVGKDLKIGSKKCLENAKVLGFSSTKNKSVVSLKLPLPDPVAAHSKRKKLH